MALPEQTLDQPPPNPFQGGAGGPGGGLPPTGMQNPAQTLGSGLMGMGEQVEKAILDLARAFPAGANEFQQAIELLKAGLARGLESGMGPPPSVSPTNAGPQFPGGGFTSGMV